MSVSKPPKRRKPRKKPYRKEVPFGGHKLVLKIDDLREGGSVIFPGEQVADGVRIQANGSSPRGEPCPDVAWEFIGDDDVSHALFIWMVGTHLTQAYEEAVGWLVGQGHAPGSDPDVFPMWGVTADCCLPDDILPVLGAAKCQDAYAVVSAYQRAFQAIVEVMRSAEKTGANINDLFLREDPHTPGMTSMLRALHSTAEVGAAHFRFEARKAEKLAWDGKNYSGIQRDKGVKSTKARAQKTERAAWEYIERIRRISDVRQRKRVREEVAKKHERSPKAIENVIKKLADRRELASATGVLQATLRLVRPSVEWLWDEISDPDPDHWSDLFTTAAEQGSVSREFLEDCFVARISVKERYPPKTLQDAIETITGEPK